MPRAGPADRRVSLSADLLALGPLVEPSWEELEDPDLPKAKLCPRLRSTYSPRLSWRGFGPSPAEAEKPPHQREWARLWEPPDAAALALALAQNPKPAVRYGLNGMTGPGRRQVWRALRLLEEQSKLMAFWTITLPPEALDRLAQLDAVHVFQDRVRKELDRRVRAKGRESLAVGVCELQPKRSARENRPCPHWHIAYKAKRWRGDWWVLEPEELDEIIRAALATAGVVGVPLGRAGRVEPIKASVCAYMACYMTKKQVDPSPWVGGPWESLLPRQWWFWTRPLRVWVVRHILPICFAFLNWCHEHREPIERRELARFRLLELPDPRAPATWEINWLGCEQFAQLVAAWQLDSWDADCDTADRIRQWQP